MTVADIVTLSCSGLSLVFSGAAIYLNVKARRLRKQADEAWQRHRALMALTFAERYGAVTPHKLAETFPPHAKRLRFTPEDEYRREGRAPDPAAFGAFIASLPPMEETEIKIDMSDPGPEAWVGGGGDFSGGGATGSFDAPSSDTPSSSSDTGSSDSGSSDCGGSSDTSSSNGSCGVE